MMDLSHSESDISLSPSQILDRLQVLRKIQLLQRGKLQKHRLQYENSPEISSSITEIVSQFSNSTSYNTFRSLLSSTQDTPVEVILHPDTNSSFPKGNLENVVEGVSVLNLSEESEFIANSVSPRSVASSKPDYVNENFSQNVTPKNLSKKHISLDEMPILSPKKDFETLISEKLKDDNNVVISDSQAGPKIKKNVKKSFLKRGEGTARFGLKKDNLVIQNTKCLPWRKDLRQKSVPKKKKNNKPASQKENVHIQIIDKSNDSALQKSPQDTNKKFDAKMESKQIVTNIAHLPSTSDNNSFTNIKLDSLTINLPKEKHPFCNSKGKTWASVLTKEQDDFLRQLKQSEYYKNFASPAKSTISDSSCNDSSKLRHEKEIAEQNLFELIENKVTHESFSIDNSFFNRFLKNNMECSGESTPLVMQRCLSKNPNLMHILPDVAQRKHIENSCSESEICNSDCLEYSDNCSVASSCCSCQTITHGNISENSCVKENSHIEKVATKRGQISKVSKTDHEEKENCHNDISTTNNDVSNMAEMNAKLIATSELLKDRLRELEDEIETFRKENANLSKMREEVDTERRKFYEEKAAFEQKFNEEKILSEYYLADEKEKLNKQKQMYERYVRDMRGRLSKKEKDEVLNLKKEINDLKDEIRIKDAKSTSTIARLRNQIKLMEKDKKNLEDEMEKLKKENKRIKHSNEITRRLTNLKYLEQINKKLSNMNSRDFRSDVELDANIKYKAFEIERQSRDRKKKSNVKGTIKPRAKSVPNLHVTSRYAKYFSQKDSLSNKEKNMTLNDDPGIDNLSLSDSDNKSSIENSNHSNSNSDEEENNLEKLYNERFKSISPKSQQKSSAFFNSDIPPESNNDYFIKKSSTNSGNSEADIYTSNQDVQSRTSRSPTIPFSRLSNESKSSKSFNNNNYASNCYTDSSNRDRSPVSILSNRSSSSHKLGTVINKEISDILVPSPEPTLSKTSLTTKTNLNPTEIKMPDGTRELRFPNGNIKFMSADGKYSKFIYYNGDIKENFYDEGRIKYYYSETKTFHTTHPDGLEIIEFPDGQVEKRYKDGSSEIRLPNGSIRYFDPKNEHVREEWRFPDGVALTVSANGEQRIVFANGQVEVHAKDHKRREFPDGSVKLVYNDGTAETRYASGRVRIKDKHGNLIMDSAPG